MKKHHHSTSQQKPSSPVCCAYSVYVSNLHSEKELQTLNRYAIINLHMTHNNMAAGRLFCCFCCYRDCPGQNRSRERSPRWPAKASAMHANGVCTTSLLSSRKTPIGKTVTRSRSRESGHEKPATRIARHKSVKGSRSRESIMRSHGHDNQVTVSRIRSRPREPVTRIRSRESGLPGTCLKSKQNYNLTQGKPGADMVTRSQSRHSGT